MDEDSKVKTRVERYIKENLNIYEQYIVNSIAEWDIPKLKNCLEYKEVNINACINSKGTTILHYAASKQDNYNAKIGNNLLSVLVQKGANLNAIDSDGLTPYDYAKIKNFKNNMVILESFMIKNNEKK